MKQQGHLIRIDMDAASPEARDEFIEICYDDSILLKRLAAYPYVQLAVVCVFFFVVLMALLSSKRPSRTKCGWDCRRKPPTSWALRSPR